MSRTSSAEPLLAYTDWLRSQWRAHLEVDPGALGLGVGEHADGRFGNVGETVRHIFSGELRYVDRILGREARDLSAVPAGSVEALFALGEESRAALRNVLERFPEDGWEEEHLYPIGPFEFEGSPWKIVVHVLLHEIRHWAQLSTLLRLQGRGPELHDFLVSPVLGGEFRRRPPDQEVAGP